MMQRRFSEFFFSCAACLASVHILALGLDAHGSPAGSQDRAAANSVQTEVRSQSVESDVFFEHETAAARVLEPEPDQATRGSEQGIRFVDATADPNNSDGLSWQTAYPDLQQALADANADGGTVITEIRIAEGEYLPDAGTGNRKARFSLANQSNLDIVGGFPAGGGDMGDRDPEQYHTVLSGDLNGDDEVSFNLLEFDEELVPLNRGTAGVSFDFIDDNSFTVLGASGADDTVVVDGVIVEGGHDLERGGGLFAANSGIALRDVTFRHNSAGSDGGGVFLVSSSSNVTFYNCTFELNSAGHHGGAVYVRSSDVSFSDTTFRRNSAGSGGAAFLDAAPDDDDAGAVSIMDGMFESNVATEKFAAGGGGLFAEKEEELYIRQTTFAANVTAGDGGGAFVLDGSVIIRCHFEGNTAGDEGGGAWCDDFNEIALCTFIGNRSGGNGGGVLLNFENDLLSSLMVGNTARGRGGGVSSTTRANSLINCTIVANEASKSGGVFGTDSVEISNTILWNNLDTDSATLERAQLGGAFHSVSHSLIDGLSDFGGNSNIGDPPDFIDEPGADGTPGTNDDDLRLSDQSPAIDAGDNGLLDFDEFDPRIPEEDLDEDLNGNPRFSSFGDTDPVTIDMGAYEMRDCNANGMRDGVDLDHGASDCNENEVPDSCDIADGDEQDADSDGVPDSCERCNELDIAEPFGILDGADVNAFITAFGGGDAAADLNEDGVVDGADVNAFITAFAVGCK